MVGKEGKNMTYNVAVTNTGQMTLPKVLREKYGIIGRALVSEENGKVVVRRAKTDDEILAEIHGSYTSEERTRIRHFSGMTAREAREEWTKSGGADKYFKEKYNV